jgi:hypothetical protein
MGSVKNGTYCNAAVAEQKLQARSATTNMSLTRDTTVRFRPDSAGFGLMVAVHLWKPSTKRIRRRSPVAMLVRVMFAMSYLKTSLPTATSWSWPPLTMYVE